MVLLVQVDTRPLAFRPTPWAWQGGVDWKDQIKSFVQDNRVSLSTTLPRPYIEVTATLNGLVARQTPGWTYCRAQMPPEPLQKRHASWCKVRWLLDSWDSLRESSHEPPKWCVIIDSDAWIRDAYGLEAALDAAGSSLVLAGEPACKETQEHDSGHVNGGFLAVRGDMRDEVKAWFQEVWDVGEAQYHTEWPWEQKALNACLLKHPEIATVLPLESVNTPAGGLVAHCWWKNVASMLAVDDLVVRLAAEVVPDLVPQRLGVEIVVARYTESVAWLAPYIGSVDKITLYTKSDAPLDLPPHPKVHVVKLPNVGREAHTYLHHIVSHYDDLTDTVIFTQGTFSDHLSRAHFLNMVKGGIAPPLTRGLDTAWTSSVMARYGWTCENNWDAVRGQNMLPAGQTLGDFYKKYVARDEDAALPPESKVDWYMNAIFCASRHAIQSHPLIKYEALLDLLEASGPNPEISHYLERSWRALFC